MSCLGAVVDVAWGGVCCDVVAALEPHCLASHGEERAFETPLTFLR